MGCAPSGLGGIPRDSPSLPLSRSGRIYGSSLSRPPVLLYYFFLTWTVLTCLEYNFMQNVADFNLKSPPIMGTSRLSHEIDTVGRGICTTRYTDFCLFSGEILYKDDEEKRESVIGGSRTGVSQEGSTFGVLRFQREEFMRFPR